jgi:ABC-2 type transport system permease protein
VQSIVNAINSRGRLSSNLILPTPGFDVLLRLRLTILRNRIRQLLDQSPLRVLLVVVFVAAIWAALYGIMQNLFVFMRRFEQQAVIAVPYVFHIFFAAMTCLLAFSTAVLVYGALFGRSEPKFLLTTPHQPRDIVAIVYLESLFFSSWSLILLGIPLMMAIGRAQGLSWEFYAIFLAAFLGFVPIPGAIGLIAAVIVALWLPKFARQVLVLACVSVGVVILLWWGRLWAANSSGDSYQWLRRFLGELEYLKGAMLPSTWVTNAISNSVQSKPADAVFYLAVIWATALFFSWSAVGLVGSRMSKALARAQMASTSGRIYSGYISRLLTTTAFFYVPKRLRVMILKDVRGFLRDPLQWSQLVILLGLLALYLVYLPTTRPEGFNIPWQALICFLNYGAVTLILSTFTSRFVFPLMSMEGRQMWMVALLPLKRDSILWAKFLYAMTVTSLAAVGVTALSIWALQTPLALSLVQAGGTMATCMGLCGLAVGLGARLPSYQERNSGRIASGLGGTVNLIASVALVAASVTLMGGICYRMVGQESLTYLDSWAVALAVGLILLGVLTALLSMRAGARSFRRQDF